MSIYFSNMMVKQDRNKIPENNATSTDLHLRKNNWKACPEKKNDSLAKDQELWEGSQWKEKEICI